MNTRITTVRIPDKRIQEIDSLCKKTGSCRNSWINAAIDFALDKSTEYDFGDDDPEEPKVTVTDVPEKKEIPHAKVTRISYDDGKTWYDVA